MLWFSRLNEWRRRQHFTCDSLLIRNELSHLALRPHICLPVLELVVKSNLQVRVHILRQVLLFASQKVNHVCESFWVPINKDATVISQLVGRVSGEKLLKQRSFNFGQRIATGRDIQTANVKLDRLLLILMLQELIDLSLSPLDHGHLSDKFIHFGRSKQLQLPINLAVEFLYLCHFEISKGSYLLGNLLSKLSD